MIQCLKQMSGVTTQPEKTVRLLIQCFAVLRECFAATAMNSDDATLGQVCYSKPPFTLLKNALTPSFQQEMVSQTLDNSADHNRRVQIAELSARLADCTRGDFMALRSALNSLEQYFQDLWCTLKLDPATGEPLSALFLEQKKYCEVTGHFLDSLVSRYDRFLNLVWSLRSHSNWCLIQHVTAAELHQYPDDRTKCGGYEENGRACGPECTPGTVDGCPCV